MGGAVAMATRTMPSCWDVIVEEEEEEEERALLLMGALCFQMDWPTVTFPRLLSQFFFKNDQNIRPMLLNV